MFPKRALLILALISLILIIFFTWFYFLNKQSYNLMNNLDSNSIQKNEKKNDAPKTIEERKEEMLEMLKDPGRTDIATSTPVDVKTRKNNLQDLLKE